MTVNQYMQELEGLEFTVENEKLMIACKMGVPYKTGGEIRLYGAEGAFNYYMTAAGFHVRFNQLGNVTSMEVTNYDDATFEDGVWKIPKGVDVMLGFSAQLFFIRYPNPDRFPYRTVENMDLPEYPYEFHIIDGTIHMKQYHSYLYRGRDNAHRQAANKIRWTV